MSKRSHRNSRSSRNRPDQVLMTPKTKDFIQKICYKKTASIDMTKYGFITESKMGPINAYVKPLREQLEKIIEASKDTDNKTIIKSKRHAMSAGQSEQFSVDYSLNKYMKAKMQQKSVVFSL